MRDLANGMFQLDRGVLNVKAIVQPFFYIAQNSLTHRKRNIGNGNMARERVRL